MNLLQQTYTYEHIILDLETLDSSPTAAIIAIGAVRMKDHSSFYIRVDPKDAEVYGTVSKATMEWWNKPENAEARVESFGGKDELLDALEKFEKWVFSGAPAGDTYLWSKGSDFDLPILRNAYENFGTYPFDFRNHRCLRTLYGLIPSYMLTAGSNGEVGKKHTAIADAKYQAALFEVTLNYLNQPRVTL